MREDFLDCVLFGAAAAAVFLWSGCFTFENGAIVNRCGLYQWLSGEPVGLTLWEPEHFAPPPRTLTSPGPSMYLPLTGQHMSVTTGSSLDFNYGVTCSDTVPCRGLTVVTSGSSISIPSNSIISAGCGNGGPVLSTVTSWQYVATASDCGSVRQFTQSALVAVPEAGTTGFYNGWYATFCAHNGHVRIAPYAGLIGGVENYVVADGTCVGILSDGNNYDVMLGGGNVSDLH